MTTQDLINRLRDTASKGVSVWGDLQMEAAKEIETLLAERECYASAMDRMQAALAEPSEPKPYCCYCESDNEGIRSTYFDQTCEGCVKRMTHPAPRPEPVATVQRINGITIGYLDVMQPVGTKLYTHTEPKPEPLRDDEVGDIARGMNIEITQDNEDTLLDFARAVEQAVISRMKP